MKQHPLIAYSSLIRGGLHLIPGGFDPPAHKRVRREDLPPEPFSPSSTLAARFADAVWARLRKIYAAFLPGPNTISQSTINSSDDRRQGCDAQSES